MWRKSPLTKTNTTIVNGAGNKDDIKGRVNQIKGSNREYYF